MKIVLIGVLVFFPVQMYSNIFSNFLTEKKAHDAYMSNSFAQAESEYAKMLLQSPYSAETNYNMGCVLHKQKKFDTAQNYFNRAIQYAEPKSKLQEQALFNRGNNFAVQKKIDEAIADYKQVLKMNPNNESAKKNLKACEQMKKEEKKQEQQKQKDKNKDQDKNKEEKNQQSDQNQKNDQNEKSDDGSNQDQQSSEDDGSKDPKKDQKGNEKKGGKQKSQDQKGDAEDKSPEQEKSQQKQDEGLEKSKNKKSQEKQNGKKEKQEKTEHKKSSEQLNKKQSTDQNKDGKDQSSDQEKPELRDAYAKEMMGKPSDDNRLDKKSAMLLDKLDDYEKNIQKKLLQMNVTKQGAQKHGQKNW